MNGLSAQNHLALVRAMDAGEKLHAGALPRAVLAEKREHRTGFEIEGDRRHGDGAAEALAGRSQAGNGRARGLGARIRRAIMRGPPHAAPSAEAWNQRIPDSRA
ncbi:hypothetical protein GCM10011390_26530 [Aureimonas endophytica]|uniref:Uncharacterized protein n=1 Tax=Aureimonas endophytica TaxID=2027858 RepID=A0A917E6R7_9HYPH|nr:hypothetical protein GCM10011390_26530 [Aureimonas endophytica]